ncbi:MAG: hypothetical protein HUJ29_02870 [Gammaproteobacteria bacterium]|nr:hypothetical protein [Gammaproteobacteria bacterium]
MQGIYRRLRILLLGLALASAQQLLIAHELQEHLIAEPEASDSCSFVHAQATAIPEQAVTTPLVPTMHPRVELTTQAPAIEPYRHYQSRAPPTNSL